MDKNNIKDNILRQCHHHKKDGVEKVELRNYLMNDDLLDECCKELIDEDYITKQDPLYFITPKGYDFASRSSYSCPNMPIVY